MRYLLNRTELLESISRNEILFIVDVQKSYSNFFTDNYINELYKYSRSYDEVYQIWDNHVFGISDSNYATNPNIKTPDYIDVYNMCDKENCIEKRYFYLTDIKIYDFFEDRIDNDTYSMLRETKSYKKGDSFKTKEGTTVIYVENKHEWFEIPIKLQRVIDNIINTNRKVTLVGGADGECLLDISSSFDHFGLKYTLDHSFIYSATHCPK